MRSFCESGPRLTRLESYEGAIACEGIGEVVTSRLPEGVRGACVRCGRKEAIFISRKAKESKATELETLSHERCHLAQNALYRLSSSKTEVDSAERKATAASYKELLPLPYVIDALFERKMSCSEIARGWQLFPKDSKYRIFFETFFYLGARCGEMQGLQWKDFDHGAREIFIHQQVQYYKSKKRSAISPAKTKSSVRHMRLSPFIADEIEKLREGYGQRDDYFIFFGRTPITKNPIVSQLTDHCKLAGVPVISPHEIRHTVASWLVANCKDMSDLIVVQRWLGHASLKETLDTYSHYLKGEGSEVTAVLDKANKWHPRKRVFTQNILKQIKNLDFIDAFFLMVKSRGIDLKSNIKLNYILLYITLNFYLSIICFLASYKDGFMVKLWYVFNLVLFIA